MSSLYATLKLPNMKGGEPKESTAIVNRRNNNNKVNKGCKIYAKESCRTNSNLEQRPESR